MPTDAWDFIQQPSSQEDYVINHLLNVNSAYGLIAGRTGLGKTNLMLNLGSCLSTGKDFLGMKVRKRKVLYLAFEGGEQNLRDRLFKIINRNGVPADGYFGIDIMNSFILSKKEAEFRKLIQPYDIVFIDPVKWLVGTNYTKPDVVSEFTRKLTDILRQDNKQAIMSIQIRKSDSRLKVEPGEIFELKGAGDYAEDATFVLMLERRELRGQNIPAGEKEHYLTLYKPKHREGKEATPVNLYYDYDNCEFIVQ